jgi:hypothetical protein
MLRRTADMFVHPWRSRACMGIVPGPRQADEIDLAENTAHDYSIMVEDPAPECVDPDIWKGWFEERFGAVAMVTVCLDNGPLLRLLKKKRFVENEMLLDEFIDDDGAPVTQAHSGEPKTATRMFLEVTGAPR